MKKKNPNSSSVVRYHFPYVKFHGRSYPLIPITLKHKNYTVKTLALIDSGATVSVFRPEIAKALHLDFRRKPLMSLGSVGGAKDVSLMKVSLKIQKSQFTSRIGFSSQPLATFNILGREGFFSKFSIAFNEIMQIVILVPLENLSS